MAHAFPDQQQPSSSDSGRSPDTRRDRPFALKIVGLCGAALAAQACAPALLGEAFTEKLVALCRNSTSQ